MNPQNDMITNVMKACGHVMARLCQLRPIITQMESIEEKKMCINAAVISIMRYCAPLYYGQTENVVSRFHTTIMTCYRSIYAKPTYKMRCEKICKNIKMPMPKELLAKDSVKLLHKIIDNRKPLQVNQLLKYPMRCLRSTMLTLRHQPKSERTKRGLIYSGLITMDKIPHKIRSLPNETFKGMISRYDFNILSPDEQRN